MKFTMIPNNLTKEMFAEVQKVLDEIENNPETKNDYCLVDLIGDEINIKVFVGEKVDETCRQYSCTPREFLMEMMRDQND